jgi:Multiubiquitin
VEGGRKHKEMEEMIESEADSHKNYIVRIDEETYRVGPTITGDNILELVGKNSSTHFVTQIIVGADDVVVEPDDEVDVTQPGRERFTTVVKSICTITVNTRTRDADTKMISFEQVVGLAFPDWQNDDPQTTEYTVTYDGGVPDKPEGSLVAGSSVRVRCGMNFDVDRTDRS